MDLGIVIGFLKTGDTFQLKKSTTNNKNPIETAISHFFLKNYELALDKIKDISEKAMIDGDMLLNYQISIVQLAANASLNQVNKSHEQFLKFELLKMLVDLKHTAYPSFWELMENLGSCTYEFRNEEYQTALVYLENAMNIAKENQFKMAFEVLILMGGEINLFLNNYTMALSYFFEYRDKFYGLENSQKTRMLQGLSQTYLQFGYLHLALYYLNEMAKICRVEQDIENLAYSLQEMAKIYLALGETDEAGIIFTENKELMNHINNKFGNAVSEFQLGIIQFKKGSWDEALNIFMECKDLFEELGDIQMRGQSLKFIAEIHRLRGEFGISKKFYDEIVINSPDVWNLAEVYSRRGVLLSQEKQFIPAINNLQNSASLFLKIGENIKATEPLFNLLKLEIDLGNHENARKYFQLLSSISTSNVDKSVEHRSRLAKALILKHKKRMSEKVKAMDILREIVFEEDIFDVEIWVLSGLNLSELLIEELKTYQNDDVLKELNTIIERIYDEVSYRAVPFLFDILLLKSKILLIGGDIQGSTRILENAENLVLENDLTHLIIKLKDEREMLQKQLNQWEELYRKKETLSEKLQLANIDSYIKKLRSHTIHEGSE